MLKLESINEILLRAWILMFAAGITKIGPFPVKAAITILFLFFSSAILLSKKDIFVKHKSLLLTLCFWISASIALGIINGYQASTISHATSLIISFLVVIFSFLLYNNRKLNKERLEQTIYFTVMIGVLLKIFIAAGLALDFFTASHVNEILELYFGTSSETVHSFGGFLGVLPRIGNAGDLFYLVVFLFYAKKYSGIRFFQMWTLTLIFVLISYSRYLMIVFLLTSIYFASGALKNRPLKTTIVIATLTAILVGFFDLDELTIEFSDRFTGQIQSESDSIRMDMLATLSNTIYENLFFGIGMGGYIHNFTRSDQNLWMYELEYLAMLMQFGIFGFIFIVINYSIYVLLVLFKNHQKELTLPMIMSTVFWLGTPLQSSLFTGTQSSLIVLSIFFLSREVRSNVKPCIPLEPHRKACTPIERSLRC